MPRFDQIDSSLFAGLDPAARSDVERHMEPRQLGAGEVLCREGEEGGSLFVVTNGLLHAVAASGAVLGRQRPGDVVGEAALLTGEPRSATLVARLPSEVLELSRDAFLAAGRTASSAADQPGPHRQPPDGRENLRCRRGTPG